MAAFTWTGTSTNVFNDGGSWDSPPNFDNTETLVVDTAASIVSVGANSDGDEVLIVNNAGAKLTLDGAVNPALFLTSATITAGTLDLATAGTLDLGLNGAGTLVLGASGHVAVGSGANARIMSDGLGKSVIDGSGAFDLAGGTLIVSSDVSVAGTDTTQFNIGTNGVLEFDGAVNGGTVVFGGTNGVLFLNTLQPGAFAGGIAIQGLFGTNKLEVGAGSTVRAIANGTNSATVTIVNGGTETLTLAGDYSSLTGVQAGQFFSFNVCYAAGTSILTDAGEVAVETLRAGDTVMTVVDGRLVPQTVKWMGNRTVDLARHPKPETAAPIRISTGALGDNLPHRDLVVSPDHALFIDGKLFPAKLLVNDMTIVQDMEAASVVYYHIELDQHAILVAEGVEAESYLDTGNRDFFANAGLATRLHPEFTIDEHLKCWEAHACAPLAVAPELVKPVWQRFVDRAEALGFSAPVYETTEDAAIHMLVDGKVLRPLSATDRTVSFMLPATAKSIRLVSRAIRPSALTPWRDDPRTLGVAIRSVTLRDRTGESVMGADHPALRDGWHAPETAADGSLWRWSTGNGELPIELDGPCAVQIALGGTTSYIVDRVAA